MKILAHHQPEPVRQQSQRPLLAAPDLLPAFPDAVRVRPEAGRIRWKEPDGVVLEWDSHEGALDVYGPTGWHLGEYDHVHGGMLTVAAPGRRLLP